MKVVESRGIVFGTVFLCLLCHYAGVAEEKDEL